MKITTVAELELMTQAERAAHFRASIVRDLSPLPADYLERIRAKAGPDRRTSRPAEPSEGPKVRTVRGTAEMFGRLYQQLREDDASDTDLLSGNEFQVYQLPSRQDFRCYELFNIVEEIGTGFDKLPEVIPGRSDYRVLITVGRMVNRMSVLGQIAPDGAVDLLDIDIEVPA